MHLLSIIETLSHKLEVLLSIFCAIDQNYFGMDYPPYFQICHPLPPDYAAH